MFRSISRDLSPLVQGRQGPHQCGPTNSPLNLLHPSPRTKNNRRRYNSPRQSSTTSRRCRNLATMTTGSNRSRILHDVRRHAARRSCGRTSVTRENIGCTRKQNAVVLPHSNRRSRYRKGKIPLSINMSSSGGRSNHQATLMDVRYRTVIAVTESHSVMTTASCYQILLIGRPTITMPTSNPLTPAYHPMTRLLPSTSLPRDTRTLFLRAITRTPRIRTVPRIATLPVLLLSITPISPPLPTPQIPSSLLGFRIPPPSPFTAGRRPRIPSPRRCLQNRHVYCRRASKTRTRRSK